MIIHVVFNCQSFFFSVEVFLWSINVANGLRAANVWQSKPSGRWRCLPMKRSAWLCARCSRTILSGEQLCACVWLYRSCMLICVIDQLRCVARLERTKINSRQQWSGLLLRSRKSCLYHLRRRHHRLRRRRHRHRRRHRRRRHRRLRHHRLRRLRHRRQNKIILVLVFSVLQNTRLYTQFYKLLINTQPLTWISIKSSKIVFIRPMMHTDGKNLNFGWLCTWWLVLQITDFQ